MSSYFTIQWAIKPGLQGFSLLNPSEFELTEVREVKMPCVILGTAGQRGLQGKRGRVRSLRLWVGDYQLLYTIICIYIYIMYINVHIYIYITIACYYCYCYFSYLF